MESEITYNSTSSDESNVNDDNNDDNDDALEIIELANKESDVSDDSDDDANSNDSDDPGDELQASLGDATGANIGTKPPMNVEEKAKQLHKLFPNCPIVLTKRILKREDVREDFDKAVDCIKLEMFEKVGPPVRKQQSENASTRDPQSFEEKVKCLNKEFQVPPFVIRRILNLPEINQDLEKAKTRLKGMASNKGAINGSSKQASKRGGHGNWDGGNVEVNQERPVSTEENPDQMCNQQSMSTMSKESDDEQLPNAKCMSRAQKKRNRRNRNKRKKNQQQPQHGQQQQHQGQQQQQHQGQQQQQQQQRQWQPQQRQQHQGQQQQQQQQRQWQPQQQQQLQQQHPRGFEHGGQRGQQRGCGYVSQMGRGFMQGFQAKSAQSSTPYYPLPLMEVPTYQAPPAAGMYRSVPFHPSHQPFSNPPSSFMEGFVQGSNQRNGHLGKQNTRGRGITHQDARGNTGRQIEQQTSQPVEPNIIVLRGLSEKATIDGIKNFIEARTSEEVLDISISDDYTNAVITLNKISNFQRAQQRVSERQLEGSKVSIERMPLCSMIKVTGLSPKTTHDCIDYYFSAKARSDVSNIVLNDDHAVVTFKDSQVIERIINTQHTLEGASLKVCKYHPFIDSDNGKQPVNKAKIPIMVDPNIMKFIYSTGDYQEELQKALQNLGFILHYKTGETFLHITPKGGKRTDNEKGVEEVNKFVHKFTAFKLNIPDNHREVVIAGLYELQQALSTVSFLLVPPQNGDMLVVCQCADSADLKNRLQNKIKETENNESRKTYQTQTIDIEEEKIAVLDKFKFVENHLSKSEFPDLDVEINDGKIIMDGPKKQFSEAKIKLYQYLSKMKEREVSLTKTVIEMLSTSEDGMENIRLHFAEQNISAVFCLDEDENKTSVIGVSKQDADDAAKLVTRLMSEVKIKVEQDNREVLKSNEWKKLCNELKAKFGVHVRRNEYLDTWIAGFNNDVRNAHEEVQKFLEKNSIGKEAFRCKEDGVRRYIIENRKRELDIIETDLNQYSVTVKQGEENNEFVICGSKIGIARAQKTLDLLSGSVAVKVVKIQQPGLNKFNARGGLDGVVTKVQNEHRCTIQPLTRGHSPRALSPSSESESDLGAFGALQDGIDSDDDDDDDGGGVLFSTRPTVTVSSGGQSMVCGNTTISWKSGDIVNEIADALVGSEIGQLAQAFQISKNSISPGNVLTVVPPPHLNQGVLHLILTHCASRHHAVNADQILRQTVQRCLQEAQRLNIQSIAFPVLGTSGLGFSVDDASRIMINEVITTVNGWLGVRVNDIRFVVHKQNQPLITAFQKEFTSHMNSSAVPSRTTLFGNTGAVPGNSGGIPGNVNVDIVSGDLIKEGSDAIVNIVGTNLDLSKAGKVSKAILLAYPAVQGELTGVGQQSEGKVVITSAGGMLKCRNIVHVACDKTGKQNSQAAIENCLHASERYGHQTISLPAFGTGSFGLDAANSAEATFNAIANVRSQLKNLKQISIVIYQDPSMVATFQKQRDLHHGQSVSSRSTKVPSRRKTNQKDIVSPKQSPSMSFKIYGRSSEAVDDAETSFIKGCTDSCKTQVIENEDVSKLSERQRNLLLRKANESDVSIKFESRLQRVVVKGDNDDVATIANDVWKEIQERSKKEKDSEQAKVLYKTVRWHYELNGQTAHFTKSVNAVIEKAYVNKDKKVTVTISGQRTVIDIDKGTGFEPATGRQFTVARTTVGASHGGDTSYPQEWSPMPLVNGKPETVRLFDVLPGSNEFQRVQNKFTSTGGRNIQRIQRIQNPQLYEQYIVRKRNMDKENPSGQNEMQLFHGTAEKNLADINKTGFNRSFCGANGTAYGNGVYFALNASYSMGYAKGSIHNNQKHMYLAKVLVGRYTQGRSGLLVPPKDPNTNTHYNSVANSTGGGASIFVVFYDAQCYPDYLITFT